MAPTALTGAGNVGSVLVTAGTTIAVPVPSAVTTGDLLLAVVYVRQTGASYTSVPAGWEPAALYPANGTIGIYTHPVTSSATEPASYTWTASALGGRGGAAIIRVTGADLGAPVDAVGAGIATGSTSVVMPAVNAVSAEALLIAVATMNIAGAAATITSDASMTEVTELQVTAGSSTSIDIAQQALAAAGPTGTRTATATGTTSVAGIMLTIAPKVVPASRPEQVDIWTGAGWADITDDVRVSERITISRGRADEQSSIGPSKCGLRLSNPDGRYSPRLPSSPYAGKIGRNTPLRVSVRAPERFLDLPGGTSDQVTCPDTAALGITGDLDVRIEVTTSYWLARELASKWKNTGNQRSWAFQIDADGALMLAWTTDGTTGTLTSVTSTVSVPLHPGRRALRAVLDADNGAGGHAVTFYTADGMAGPWTQLGDPVTGAGTVSVFDSTAGLEVGRIVDLGGLVETIGPFLGRAHAFELRDSTGTVVADPVFSVPAVGAASWADSTGNTWTAGGDAAISDRDYRFWGEVPAWPVTSHISGNNVTVKLTAAGIVRRLTAGDATLDSAWRRFMLAQSDLVAYWPCEDAERSTRIGSAVPSGLPMRVSGRASFAAHTGFDCSLPLPTIENTILYATPGTYTVTDDLAVRALMAIPSGGATNNVPLVRLYTAGTCAQWEIVYTTASSGTLTLNTYNADDAVLSSTVLLTGMNGVPCLLSVELTQNGANVDWSVNSVDAATGTGTATSGTLAGRTFRRLSQIAVGSGNNTTSVAVGHLSVQNATASFFPNNAVIAHAGEVAGRRAERLCAEENITFRAIGHLDDTAPMGPQHPLSLVDLLVECETADQGLLFEPRDCLGIGYRTRASRYNAPARLQLNHAAGHLSEPLEPIDDDQNLRNDVTASRKDGSSTRVADETGPLGTTTVGRYAESLSVNVTADGQLPDLAGWRVHLGTVDEPRHPSISVSTAAAAFRASPALTSGALAVEISDRITIDDPPPHLPQDQIDQVALGISEVIRPGRHDLAYMCVPARPWDVAVYDVSRYDTAGSALAAAVSTAAATLSVTTTSGPIWTVDPADMPFDIRLGGERITVTAVTGESSPQTFTVVRSVNGVTRSHSAGTAVSLWSPAVYAL